MSGLPPLARTSAPKAPSNAADPLRRACQEFESLFLLTLMREGRGASPTASAGGDSLAVGIGRDMRDESLSREMSRAGGLGLGDLLQSQLSVNFAEKKENTTALPPQVFSTPVENPSRESRSTGPRDKRSHP